METYYSQTVPKLVNGGPLKAVYYVLLTSLLLVLELFFIF